MIISDKERQAPIKIEETEPTHLARYKFAEQYIKQGDKVLDAPCGSGYGTKLISLKGAKTYGVDIHEGAIKHAKEFFLNDSDYFYVGNIEDMKTLFPSNEFFDVIISFEGIEHLKNPNLFLSEVKRLLKPRGILIISTPRKPHGSLFHIMEYSLDEFQNMLLSKFIIKEIYGQVYDKFYNLSENDIDPNAYEKFNFVAICSPK